MSVSYVSDLFTNATQFLAPEVTNLYAGVDTSSLNTLELLWMSWYKLFKSPVVATGVMSFLLHEVRLWEGDQLLGIGRRDAS